MRTCEVGENCSGPIDGHHDDYSRPNDLRYLYRRHQRTVSNWIKKTLLEELRVAGATE